MEVYIKIHGQNVTVEVSVEVGEYLDRADHKTENLFHEQRRHWDGRASLTNTLSPMSAAGVTTKRRKIGCVEKKPSGKHDSVGKLHCKTALPLSALRIRRDQLFPDR